MGRLAPRKRIGRGASRPTELWGNAPPASMLGHLRHALLDLLGRYIFLVGGDRPHVPGWIDNRARAIPIELVRQRALYFRPGGDGSVENRIAVLEVDAQPDRRAAETLGSTHVHLLHLIGEH